MGSTQADCLEGTTVLINERDITRLSFCATGRKSACRSWRSGFSLIEITVALSIGAILMAIGIPIVRRTLDNQSVKGSTQRFSVFLNEARQTARSHGTVVVFPLDSNTFTGAQAIRSQVPGTSTFNRTFIPDGGVTFAQGPPVSALVIQQSGDFDVTQPGYFGLTGSYPSNVSFLTFTASGAVNVKESEPEAQMVAASLGRTTTDLIAAVNLALPRAGSGGSAYTADGSSVLTPEGGASPAANASSTNGISTGGGTGRDFSEALNTSTFNLNTFNSGNVNANVNVGY